MPNHITEIFMTALGNLIPWMGGFRGLVIQGAVVHVVKLHNAEKAVDACLYTLYMCLGVTWTNRPITFCYNMINSEHPL